MGYGRGTLTGEKPLNSHHQKGGQAKQEITCFFLWFLQLGDQFQWTGEEGTAEAKGLRLPLELGPKGQAGTEKPLGSEP